MWIYGSHQPVYQTVRCKYENIRTILIKLSFKEKACQEKLNCLINALNAML